MIRWGVNALNHGSSLAIFDDHQLLVNRFDHDDELEPSTIKFALDLGQPDEIYWYERPLIKKARQLRAGQWHRFFDVEVLPINYLSRNQITANKIIYTPHHASHAAAGYYTSPFNRCVIVVLDAIGEFECASIWLGEDNKLKKLWHRNYPNSLGLFYSAFTDLIGLTPIKEEYKLQQLSTLGDPNIYYKDIKSYFNGTLKIKNNLHKGVKDWSYEINESNKNHIAAAVQLVFEEQILEIMKLAQSLSNCDALIYMGGCAMNSFANKKIVEPMFGKIWSLPQPGDPSSSIGAVLFHTKQRVNVNDFGIVKHIQIKV